MGRCVKKKFQPLADTAGIVGATPAVLYWLGGGYSAICALYFLAPRVESRRAGSVAEGISGAFEPSPTIYAAYSETPEEGEALYNIAQMRAAARAAVAGGGQ